MNVKKNVGKIKKNVKKRKKRALNKKRKKTFFLHLCFKHKHKRETMGNWA